MSGSIFYTLDRAGTLVEGSRIDFNATHNPIADIKEHIENRFWDGVSRHGNNYYFNYNANLLNPNENYSFFLEMLLEERRRASFPDKPSRLRSIFACETVREASWFRGSSKANLSTAIYEVCTESECHRADMRLLNVNCTPPELSHRLDLYWQGETKNLHPGYEPFWEVLIPLPAIIGEKVQE